MPNGIREGSPPQAEKYPNTVLRLNGRKVVLSAYADPVRQVLLGDLDDGAAVYTEPDWLSALRITEKDLSLFESRGQWNTPRFTPSGDPLKDLLGEHGVALIGGKACVVRWRKDRMPDGRSRDALDMIGKENFKTFHSNKLMEVGITTSKDGKKTTILQKRPATDQFFLDAKRYDGLVYLPHEGLEVDGAMNLWRGFGVRPEQGCWRRMQEHIHEVLASGNDEQAIYIVKWCAWTVQNPGLAAEVAKVFREREGAGKGVFVQALLRMFGIHGLHISGRKHLVGNFNRHLMYCSLLYGDEVFWGGDIKEVGELKRLITEPTLTIEPKAVDAFQMPNCLHIIMASNEDWVVPASQDARRFAVMDVSPKRIGDRAYFDRLWTEMKGGGTAAMLYDMLSMDLQGWHPRQGIPQTKALQKQKMLSLKGVDALVHMLAHEGGLPCLATQARPNAVVTTGEGCGTGFISWARHVVPSLRHVTGSDMKAALVDKWGCKRFSRDGKRGLDFPKLADLRATFDRLYGPQAWDNLDMTDWEKPQDRGASWRSLE